MQATKLPLMIIEEFVLKPQNVYIICVLFLDSMQDQGLAPMLQREREREREEIISAIRKCPSGALSYSIDGMDYRDQDNRSPQVTVLKDRPYKYNRRIRADWSQHSMGRWFIKRTLHSL